MYRDYEYKRLGTLLLITGIDLLIGEAIPVVIKSHKSSDFKRNKMKGIQRVMS